MKKLALRTLVVLGCPAAATEVVCPISRYRIDAAGYRDPIPANRSGEWEPEPDDCPVRQALCGSSGPETIFIECKASRADFLRDAVGLPGLLLERDGLRRRLEDHERTVVRELEPHLRASGSFLFPEMESWHFEASRSPPRRAILRRLRRVERALYDTTKFFMIAQYRLADRLFILAPRGMIRPAELPLGWGLLEPDGGAERAIAVVIADPRSSRPERRARVLRNIAVAATRARLGVCGESDSST